MSEKPLLSDATLYRAVCAIEKSVRRIAVVVKEDGTLIGTLTDGDIRRCLLSGGTLETPVTIAMNQNPLTAPVGSSSGYILHLLKQRNVMALPLIDERGKFVRVVHLRDLDAGKEEEDSASGFKTAVIMAGGQGIRLRPLTKNRPKPMLEIGGIPLLERQLRRLIKTGVQQVFICVNYLSHIIEEHFGDGVDFGIDIRYVREGKRLGTAGALSLLPERLDEPLIVMNGDILTTSDFGSLYTFHVSHNASMTVSAVIHRVDIPYGVIQTEGIYAVALEEKPSQRFFCNAGIYVLSPDMLRLVPHDTYYNMTDLIQDSLAAGERVAVFPVHEYWSDIGTPDDLEKARKMFLQTEA